MKRQIRVSCGVLREEGRYLIVQRPENTQHGLQWEFPGGKIEPKETAAACVVRELKEELDITVSVQQQLKTVVREEADYVIELIPFLCEIESGEITLLEHKAMEWIVAGEPLRVDLCKGDYGILAQLV